MLKKNKELVISDLGSTTYRIKKYFLDVCPVNLFYTPMVIQEEKMMKNNYFVVYYIMLKSL